MFSKRHFPSKTLLLCGEMFSLSMLNGYFYFNFSGYVYKTYTENIFSCHWRFVGNNNKILFCILFSYCLKVALSEVKGNKIIISDPWPENSDCNEQSVSVPKEFETQHTFLKYFLRQSKCHIFFCAFFY